MNTAFPPVAGRPAAACNSVDADLFGAVPTPPVGDPTPANPFAFIVRPRSLVGAVNPTTIELTPAAPARNALSLPETSRGRPTPAQVARGLEQRQAFATAILEINSRLDISVSSRGWCYLLEDYGLSKSDFDKAQDLINDLRKSGLLPLDICADDAARVFYGVETLDAPDVADELASIWRAVDHYLTGYTPVSFWENQKYFVQMVVEKIDLRSLFETVCGKYKIPIANARGWSDLNMRGDMMRRFAEHEKAGRIPVLLYCGDHDPKGLQISECLRSNCAELTPAVGWSPDNLIVDRFGLNADFIERHNLTWIDNLHTGGGGDLASPKHRDHKQGYVQRYLTEFGPRKVEANVLVKHPDAARALCEKAIRKYVNPAKIPEYESRLDLARKALLAAFKADTDKRFSKSGAAQ